MEGGEGGKERREGGRFEKGKRQRLARNWLAALVREARTIAARCSATQLAAISGSRRARNHGSRAAAASFSTLSYNPVTFPWHKQSVTANSDDEIL